MNDRLSTIRQNMGNRSSRPSAPQRRKSRREQEAHNQRIFFLSMIGAIALVMLILGGGIVYEYVVKPNAVLAEVNGHEIKRRDYWKYQSVVLFNQARQYEQFALQTQGQQQTQFLQFAAQFDAERKDVWGSTDVSASTIQRMIENQLYLDGAESMGISVSAEQAEVLALNQFASVPLVTPIPSPTMIPERAAASTATAEAMATEQAAAFVTPVASPVASPQASPVNGTPGATPVPARTDVATPVAVGLSTPASGLVVATPVGGTPGASPVAEATPNPADVRTGAEAEFEIFQDNVFGEAHLNMDDYIRLWVVPNAVRQQVDSQLTNQVPQVAPQVNAEHILVGTQELALSIYEQATGGADFEQLARASSTDTTTAPSGGQLGWFTQVEMDPAFGTAAFALQPGQISQPVQSPYGWHVIKVLETDPEHILTDAQYELATGKAIDSWLADQRQAGDVKTDYQTTPTPTAAAFEAPANAPTVAPATPIPMDLPGTPGASPGVGQATPVLLGDGTGVIPVSSPDATPVPDDPAALEATPAT